MGCDRNLFTLRLVLNQTWGEWQWQAAAEGWGGGQVCHVAQVQHYNPPPHPPQGKGSSPRPSRWIEGWREGASKGCMKRTNDEWCTSDKTACPTPQMEWLSSIPESHDESCFLHSAKCTVPDSHPVSQSVRQTGRQTDRRLVPTDLDGTRNRQLAKMEYAQKTRLGPN